MKWHYLCCERERPRQAGEEFTAQSETEKIHTCGTTGAIQLDQLMLACREKVIPSCRPERDVPLFLPRKQQTGDSSQ